MNACGCGGSFRVVLVLAWESVILDAVTGVVNLVQSIISASRNTTFKM